MTDVQDGLFAEPERLPDPPPDERTVGARRRDRMADAVQHGQHPLSVPLRISIPLHPDADHEIPARTGPTCGTCIHRQLQHGGAKRYPKCMAADGTRATRGEATDVRAHWPACTDWER